MDEAYSRSSGILNHKDTLPISIVGCGSIGSFVSLNLLKMGFDKQINLYDGDRVGVENVGCQLFGIKHIDVKKVDALADILVDLTPIEASKIIKYSRYVTDSTPIPTDSIVFMCVDSMKVRELIYEKCKGINPLIIDGRIGGQIIRVFTTELGNTESHDYYLENLYPDDEAEELPCTERNVADVAYFVAGFMSRAARRFITHKEVIKEVAFDAMTMGMYTTP